MKKLILFIIINLFFIIPAFAKLDKTDAEYLRNKKHFSIMNPLAENIVKKIIKKTLYKEIGKGHYKVQFKGYTLSSMKKGIFKELYIEGNDLVVEDIPIMFLSLKTLSDYNWIDITSEPVCFRSDMVFAYKMDLTEKSLNNALKQEKFNKKIEKINKLAYPLFTLHDVRIRIKHDKVHIIMDYSLPLASSKKKKTFMVSSSFKVENGKIRAYNVGFDNAYGNLPLDKVTNLINLIDPLSFTLDLIKDEKCNGRVENVKIIDNIIQIDGKIFISKKESKS